MRNVHIVLLTKTVLNWIKFNSSKQNFNFSKYIPRERGGLPPTDRALKEIKKYSPRTRGSSRDASLEARRKLIFPANAGVFPSALIWLLLQKHIPRERGGLPSFKPLSGNSIQYSPRTRGSSFRRLRLQFLDGIFPANAGVTLQIRPAKERYCNIPRERGGHPLFERLTFKVTGHSPRMRGSS